MSIAFHYDHTRDTITLYSLLLCSRRSRGLHVEAQAVSMLFAPSLPTEIVPTKIPRFLDSTFPGNPLRTCEFHPLE